MRSSGVLLGFFLLLQFLFHCNSFNSEGLALLSFRDRIESDPYGALSNWGTVYDPCFWFGVVCFDGDVVVLNLEDLCLGGTLAPELGQLSHMRYLILRNNTFHGPIPYEIGKLKQLEILDVALNDLSGSLPFDVSDMPALRHLIIHNNKLLAGPTLQNHQLGVNSYLHMTEEVPDIAPETCCDGTSLIGNMDQIDASGARRRSMQEDVISPFRQHIFRPNVTAPASRAPSESNSSPHITQTSTSPESSISLPPVSSPAYAPVPTPASDSDTPSSQRNPFTTQSAPPLLSGGRPFSPPSTPSVSEETHKKKTISWVVYGSIAGVSFLLGLSAILVFFCKTNKVVTVRPWATGLSGQLQKAFVTGVPRLKRVELETACEDFSNIIGSSPDGTLYKGTLSSGVEIAVFSSSIMTEKEWSKHSEAQFRKQIETLSRMNHKNFVNLLGYCEEEEPFTRMMVFEYAPNGTLFEHLHVKESEHLDWPTRLRIAMGMAYCLDHMHQLNPPITHISLHSAVVYLTDDFASKIADFGFGNMESAVKVGSANSGLLDSTSLDKESNVYSFGVLLLEMMTGRLPYTDSEGPIVKWASDYMNGAQPLSLMMDPTLRSFPVEQADALCQVVRTCTHPDPKQRPTMKEIVAQLRQITAISPDGATPRLSPLWWAELEIVSAEAN